MRDMLGYYPSFWWKMCWTVTTPAICVVRLFVLAVLVVLIIVVFTISIIISLNIVLVFTIIIVIISNGVSRH